MFGLHWSLLPNHQSKTHKVKNIVMKQSKRLKDDLKPKQKKTTSRTTIDQTTDIDSRQQQFETDLEESSYLSEDRSTVV